jgi:DNA replication protein DnaD
MSKQGFIKLYRQVQDHWLYEEKRKFSKFEAWVDMLMMANHKDNKFVLGNELVEVKKGEFITSELKLMERWNWGKAKLRSFLEMLQKDEMIIKKSDRKKTTITICNYCLYHDYETENRPQADHEQTNNRLYSDTNKNVKNDKNVKKKNSPKQVYDETSVFYQLAEYFLEQIRKNNPEHKTPNMQKWSDDIRKTMEIDERTEEQIKYLMKWVQEDDFEMSNVLSPSKLRERFDQLIIKVKKDKKTTPIKRPTKTPEQLEHEKLVKEMRRAAQT